MFERGSVLSLRVIVHEMSRFLLQISLLPCTNPFFAVIRQSRIKLSSEILLTNAKGGTEGLTVYRKFEVEMFRPSPPEDKKHTHVRQYL